jgi:hypothetical protein
MNDKDIELFAKSFVNGMQGLNTTQVSREPIQLNSSEVVDEEIKQFNSTDLELNLIIELKLFNKEINSIRASDKVFSNEYKAEEKRQAQIVKKLNKIIKK